MQPPPSADTVLVRHGELGTKSARVQARMEAQLADNVESMLDARSVPGSLDRERGRLYVRTTEDAVADATAAAADTFGVVSASPARTVPPSLPAIEDALADAADAYRHGTFAVRARRAGPPEEHDFTSSDIEEEGGAAIWDAVAHRMDPAVDLDDPDLTFYVEARPGQAFVFLEKRSGPGGFPVGTQGRVVALISGGIDSPVAAWEMFRRGCEIVPVYFDFEDYGGPDHVARAEAAVRGVLRYAPGHERPLYRVPIGPVAERLVQEVSNMRMLVLRRFMFRVGAAIAEEVDAHALATGESLGQKSSQTGRNLAATSAAIDRPVHRPLLNVDKQEIVEQAKRIGTFEEARIPAGCNRIAPSHPATGARIEEVERAEPEDLRTDLDRFVSAAERIDVRPYARDAPAAAVHDE